MVNKWGHEKRAEQGQSELYNRKTFGYENDNEGNLKITPTQADTVKLIFSLYLSGLSILRIIRELENRDIKSPTGKDL